MDVLVLAWRPSLLAASKSWIWTSKSRIWMSNPGFARPNLASGNPNPGFGCLNLDHHAQIRNLDVRSRIWTPKSWIRTSKSKFGRPNPRFGVPTPGFGSPNRGFGCPNPDLGFQTPVFIWMFNMFCSTTIAIWAGASTRHEDIQQISAELPKLERVGISSNHSSHYHAFHHPPSDQPASANRAKQLMMIIR